MSGVHTRTTGRVHVAGSFASQPVACHSAGRPASAIFLQGVLSDRHGEFARQNQKYVLIMFCLPESNGREAAALRGEESNARLRHLAHNPEGESKPEKIFFIWIRCNPLKSPDSDE